MEQGRTKFEITYESEFSKSTWKYDYSVTRNGPVSVTIHNKENTDWKPKMTIGDYTKLAKKGKLK
jgi:hypothetical protein